jgi:t-SNARE complex subunit (syntaxin)
LIAENQGH